MPDVIVVCEGQTEREFCRELVAPELAVHGVMLAGTLVGKPQRKRGGIRDWHVYRSELVRLAKTRADLNLAVLVDFYAMPSSWPGRLEASTKRLPERGKHVEDALRLDLAGELPLRFHPCVQLHEFEALLFVEPVLAMLSIAIGSGKAQPLAAERMSQIRAECGGSVEAINDHPETAPSKRISQIIPGYDKVAWGVTAAKDITLPVLRAGCPWLDRWIKTLIEIR
jgi:hypothetical protein